MKKFGDFIVSGEVRAERKNEFLAKSLIKSAEKGVLYIKKQKITSESAEHIVSDIYDTIR